MLMVLAVLVLRDDLPTEPKYDMAQVAKSCASRGRITLQHDGRLE